MLQVFWSESDIECLVACDGRENGLSDGYQVLFVEPAYEYRLTEVWKKNICNKIFVINYFRIRPDR